MSTDLRGRAAVVTGAGSGIGREIASRFARSGSKVAVCDLAADAAEKTASDIRDSGGDARAYAVDVSDFEAVQEVCSKVFEDMGSIDILVNNAGITRDGLLLRMGENDFDMVIAVNLKGAFNFIKGCTKPMMKTRWGRIINITSVVGQMGNAGQVNYASSKAGMIGMTKSVAKELAGRNITVNAVAPGFIETPMTQKLDEATRKAYYEGIPLKRGGTPEDVANACLFLASDEAAYITGQVLRVDGGMLM